MRRENLVKGAFRHYTLLVSFVFLTLLMLMTVSVAFAHKVNIFAYLEGGIIYTESYFPDGKKVQDGIIEVYDSQGNKLLEGKTDKNGQFNFKLPKKDDLKIVLVATMGHKNSYTLSADELSDTTAEQEMQESEPKDFEVEGVTRVDLSQIKSIIDSSLDEKLKPIIRELAKVQEKKVSFTDVIGGIGYIFGIMGIVLYFVSKRGVN